MSALSDLEKGLSRRNPSALARCITLLETDPQSARALLAKLWSLRRPALRIGVTGPPGAGKSTLVNKLIAAYRSKNKSVGILAVDPSSPVSGGAFLGDRIRMQEHAKDRGVFIRSMANRQKLGGTARAIYDALAAMEIFGFDVIFIETVGAGQSDTDLRPLCDTVLLLAPPDSMDIVQAMKSGLLDIADIFVVHKADLPSAGRAARTLHEMLGLRKESAGGVRGWEIPVVEVSSVKGTGLEDLLEKIRAHAKHLRSGEAKKENSERRFLAHVREILLEDMETRLRKQAAGAGAGKSKNPYEAAKAFGRKGKK